LFYWIVGFFKDKDENILEIIEIDKWLNKLHEFSIDQNSFIE
jgi:hypothetical protein